MKKAVHHLKKELISSFPPNYRKAFIILGILFFGMFTAFTFIVRSDVLRSFDFNSTVKIQDKIPVRFDNFFSFLSVTGRFEFSIIILLVVLLFRRKIFGVVVVALFGVAHLFEVVGKWILYQPGPPHMFLRTTDFSMQFPGLYVHTEASYPSGHSLRVVFISIIIIMLLYRNKKISPYLKVGAIGFVSVYAFLMVLSRVSLGEHWTTDVIGGSLLGASFGLFSLLLL
jgi:membrane-associated phospholipid phosphatase